jgi:hypothetical protein
VEIHWFKEVEQELQVQFKVVVNTGSEQLRIMASELSAIEAEVAPIMSEAEPAAAEAEAAAAVFSSTTIGAA